MSWPRTEFEPKGETKRMVKIKLNTRLSGSELFLRSVFMARLYPKPAGVGKKKIGVIL